MLIIDFETRSKCNLLTAGTANYVLHDTTEVLCCAFTPQDPEDTREWLWYPHDGPLPRDLYDEILTADLIAAHNAAFDLGIWKYVAVEYHGFPPISDDQWYCTSAQMRVNNLPASLDKAAKALDANHKKDPQGHALIRLLSIPNKDTGEFNEDPQALRAMGRYCVQDIRTTKSCVNATRLMTQREHADWLVNEAINERGVLIDIELAEAAQAYAEDEYDEIAHELFRASKGAITRHTQTVRAAGWVAEQLGPHHEATKFLYKKVNGVTKLTLDKNARMELLDAAETNRIPIPTNVREVVEALTEGSKSSVTKFKSMVLRADEEDCRVYGAFVYAGAAQTMRFSSNGLQMHNLPSRGLYENIADAWTTYNNMLDGRQIDTPVMDTLKKMLRHALMPSVNHVFVIGDWSGIEARILPWLADSDGGRAKIEKIRSGVDVYLEAAEGIGHKGHRLLGKVMELALGYEGGVNAFNVFAKMYGIKNEFTEREILEHINAWRMLNIWVVDFWRGLESAALDAMRHPLARYTEGRVTYMYRPHTIDGTLMCILPDDTAIQYPKARVEQRFGAPIITAMKASANMKVDAKEWPRETLFGGRMAGHATQATAATLLRYLLRITDDVVAHVHDEVVLEVPEAEAEARRLALKQAMIVPPEWAEGLPLDAEPEIAARYKK